MKKNLAIVFSVLLLFGVLAMSFALADDVAVGTGNSAGMGNGVITQAAGHYGEGQGVLGENMNPGAVIMSHRETEYEDQGRRVQVNQSVQDMNGTRIISITKTVTFANGSQATYTINITNDNGTISREMNMEREGEHYNVSVERGINVSSEFFGNHSQLTARLRNQSFNISVLPDQALVAALERLRIRNQTMNETNATIQLRERIHNNIPQVVYNVEANQHGRFLGIFKIAMKTNTEVDTENGTVVSVQRPWWAFLVSVPQAPPVLNQTNSTNSTNETSAPMIPVNSTNSTNSS